MNECAAGNHAFPEKPGIGAACSLCGKPYEFSPGETVAETTTVRVYSPYGGTSIFLVESK